MSDDSSSVGSPAHSLPEPVSYLLHLFFLPWQPSRAGDPSPDFTCKYLNSPGDELGAGVGRAVWMVEEGSGMPFSACRGEHCQ